MILGRSVLVLKGDTRGIICKHLPSLGAKNMASTVVDSDSTVVGVDLGDALVRAWHL